jgi:hypothetical protein
MSTAVGPLGSTRFSMRSCGAPGLDVVDRTVPAPHRAVVQPKLTQARHTPLCKGGIGILGLQRRKQRRKEPHDIVEELDGIVDPPVAQPDARRSTRPDLFGTARVEQLL